jgi:hypothetical protein
MKTIELSGIVKGQHGKDGNWFRIFLEQKNGYKIDLISRLQEAVENYGSKVAVRYWSAKNRQSKEQLQEGVTFKVLGILNAEYESEDYSYSEYTHGTDYNSILDISGHNLFNELTGLKEKFILIEIDFL